MAIWGIGAYYFDDREDKSDIFINEGTAFIGYLEKDKPEYYELIKQVKIGDVLVLKARFPLNRHVLRIKAIGMATDTNFNLENGALNRKGIKVKWFFDFRHAPEEIALTKENNRSDLANTIMKIENESLIEAIAEILKKHGNSPEAAE